MQLGSSVRSGQTSFYCRANQCSAEEGRELKRGWFLPTVVGFHCRKKMAIRDDEL